MWGRMHARGCDADAVPVCSAKIRKFIPVWGQLQLKGLLSYCQVINMVESPETVIRQNSEMGLTACV